MADVHDDVQLIEPLDDGAPEVSQAALVGLGAAAPDQRADVVGQLAHAESHVVEHLDAVQLVAERGGVLEVDDQAVLALALRPLYIVGLEDEEHPVVERVHDGPGLGYGGHGVVEGTPDGSRTGVGPAGHVDS